jgi:hypothetical protein
MERAGVVKPARRPELLHRGGAKDAENQLVVVSKPEARPCVTRPHQRLFSAASAVKR